MIRRRDTVSASPPHTEHGFTLIELMMTLAMAAIILTTAVPGFQAMIDNNRLITQTNSLVGALNYARSEAVKRGASINVVASDPSNAGNEWGKGWSVQLTDATTLRVSEAAPATVTINSTANANTLQFLADGTLNGGADTIDVCDNRSGETGYQVSISTVGRVSTSTLVCP